MNNNGVRVLAYLQGRIQEFFFIGGFLTKGWGILALRIDETLSKLIVSNLPDHIWLLYVVCRTGHIFSRFTDERRPARSD